MFLRAAWIVAISLIASAINPTGAAGQIYSYVDENGVRILTNIPPKDPALLQKASSISSSVDKNGLIQITNVSAPTKPAGREKIARPSQNPKPPTGQEPQRIKAAASVDAIIEKYAPEFQLDPSLIRSMISQESGFNPKAVSRKGAQGLMQLMPSTATRVGVRNSFDPEDNIRGGMKHMRNMLDLFNNDLDLSLAAYNAGENLVQRIGGIPNFRETHDYVRSIKKKYGSNTVNLQNVAMQEPPPRIFRYFDDKGVLHLTSTPPVERETQSTASWGSTGQSLQ